MRQGFAVWLTGTPASGKSRRARALKSLLDREGVPVQRLESDELRKVLTPTPTYSPEEREFSMEMTSASSAAIQEMISLNSL